MDFLNTSMIKELTQQAKGVGALVVYCPGENVQNVFNLWIFCYKRLEVGIMWSSGIRE